MFLFVWAVLVLAVFARAGPDDNIQTFNGNDGGWRVVSQGDPMMTESLSNPGCAEGTVARVIGQNSSIELWFRGKEIRLYGVRPPDDVRLRFELDTDERPPLPRPHAGPPVQDACELLHVLPVTGDRVHKLTVTVGEAGANAKLYIANATVYGAPVTSETSVPLELPGSTAPEGAPNATKSPATSVESTSPTTASESKDKRSSIVIAAAAVGSLVLFFALGFGVYWLVHRRRSRTPPSAAFRARMARADFVMVTNEHGHSTPTYNV